MQSFKSAAVTGINGHMGYLEPDVRPPADAHDHILLRLENGQGVWVPSDLLRERSDGAYYLPVAREELAGLRPAESGQEARVPRPLKPGQAPPRVPPLDDTQPASPRMDQAPVVGRPRTPMEVNPQDSGPAYDPEATQPSVPRWDTQPGVPGQDYEPVYDQAETRPMIPHPVSGHPASGRFDDEAQPEVHPALRQQPAFRPAVDPKVQTSSRRGAETYVFPASRPAPPAQQKGLVVPVVEEELQVSTHTKETGVRVSKNVQTEQRTVDEPGYVEQVDVQRFPRNEVVDEPQEPRQEGDTLIISVYEEQIFIEKRLVLREEIHIKKWREEIRQPRQVTLRREEVSIDEIEP